MTGPTNDRATIAESIQAITPERRHRHPGLARERLDRFSPTRKGGARSS